MGGGEVVQVHGGHIIRSTAGKKDRHSKVYTAKGPRDRRVRLAAHTAIQFYDVQDRLGFDRPSKAVDWLIEKAQYAIDKLPPLPPFDPNTGREVNLTDVVHSPSLPPPDSNLQESAGFGGSGYPHRDLCLSLQSFEPEGPFSAEYGGGWSPYPAEMGRFSRLLGWDGGGGERVTLQSNFQSQSLVRDWDGVQGDPTRDHMEQQRLGVLGSDRFMEFCIPNQTSRDGDEDVNGMMMAAHHHHHHHRGASSISTTTDSSH